MARRSSRLAGAKTARSSKAGPGEELYEYGEPWWESDPHELASDRSKGYWRQQALFMAFALIAVAAIVHSSHAGLLAWNTTVADVVTSPHVSPQFLAGFRVLAAALVLVVDYVFPHVVVGVGVLDLRLASPVVDYKHQHQD